MGFGEKEKVFVGIDPGQTGAIAMVTSKNEFVGVWDWPGDERSAADLLRSLHLEHRVAGVVIERQHAFPGQGVSSTFNLGVNYGAWLMALAILDWPAKIVRPVEWKRGMGYPEDRAAMKSYSLITARRMFPLASDRLGRKKDHNRAEALLLADVARKTFG